MLIAKEKRKTNIAEYILYIWQLEDLLRALNFDLEQIGSTLVARFNVDENTRLDIYQYYKNMVLMMEKEQLKQSGHIQAIVNVADDLNQFHLNLLQSPADPAYKALYQLAKPLLDEFRMKSNDVNAHDVQVALQALYGVMLLKLQHKTITQATEQATAHISKLVAHLAARYRQFEEGDFEL
jgi:DNA-binding FadR family transcriptional regulator